ncbi:uncharacterized protein LOC132729160 isoform X2 [Ruditapes philippinarum]|uniref:uncharacterized protein LOC132729160 isoform X2 n=1 Tax=Ruditapes philippinarum TaxID=129788 RepID=UPI00295BDBA4|nr:uncharacterized protein LOC132729160 isoform X2 [Ruditapes philippinarum]
MGELFRPYIIYLTSEIEEELRKLIKQYEWKIGTFKRVHQDLWYFIDLIIKQEELALDTIEKCKKHTEGIRKAQKRKCSDKSTNTEKSNKIFRNDSYEISYSIELEDTDHNEIRRMISSGDETPNYHNYTFNQPEGKPVDATCSYDKGEAEQKYSNDKNVILENSMEKLDSSKSVQEKALVQISGLDNVEMKTSLSDSNHETYQIESIPNNFLMNIQDNCNGSVKQNSCVDGVNKDDIPSVDTTIKSKSTNYNFWQRRCLDRFEMFELRNISEQQDKLRCDICGKLFVSERSLKYHKEKIHSDKTLKLGDKKIKPQKELEVTACQICRKQFADSKFLIFFEYSSAHHA